MEKKNPQLYVIAGPNGAGKTQASFLRRQKVRDYSIHLFFLWIPSIELAIGRIKDRVASGGHDVEDADVRRRFSRSISNLFKLYRPLLDSWYLFDNSTDIPCLIAKEKGGHLTVIDTGLFTKISRYQYGK